MTNLILWTTLPNGIRWIADDSPELHISIVMSPKLGLGTTDTRTLSDGDYSMFANWPNVLTGAGFKLDVLAGESPVEGESPTQFSLQRVSEDWDNDFWASLFVGDTPVRPFGVEQASVEPASYDANLMRQAINLGYVAEVRSLARSLLPGAEGLSQNPIMDALLGKSDPASRVLNTSLLASQISAGFRQFGLFNSALEEEADPTQPPVSPANDLDFHDILSALQEHNALYRKLGMAVDFRCRLSTDQLTALGQTARLRINVDMGLKPGTDMQSPWTVCEIQPRIGSTQLGVFHPRRTDGATNDTLGFRSLRSDVAQLVNHDVDWIAQGLIATSRQLQEATSTSDSRDEYAAVMPLPTTLRALRGTGIGLIDLPNQDTTFATRLPVVEDVMASQQRAIDLQASPSELQVLQDGLIRGYRVMVRDLAQDGWKSLCSRKVEYVFSTGPLAGQSWTVAGDEGEIGKVVAQHPDGQRTVSPFLWLWDGWSLSVPPVLSLTDDDGDPASADEQPVSGLLTKSWVLDGSLPRKRFDHAYEFSVLTVDLAGNSWSLKEAEEILQDGALPIETASERNVRVDPIRPPSIRENGDDRPGESGAVVALRSKGDVTEQPTTVTIQPPDASLAFVIEHGAFDELTDDESLDALGKLALVEGSGSEGQSSAGDSVGYLSDPLCRSVMLRSRVGQQIAASASFAAATESDDPASSLLLKTIPLSLVPGGAGTQPEIRSTGEALEVQVPRGEIFRAELSATVWPEHAQSLWISQLPAELLKMGVQGMDASGEVERIESELRDAMANGSEYLVTPAIPIDFVHAVDKPLKRPEFGPRLRAERTLRSVASILTDEDFALHVPSTGRIEFDATWFDKIDIPGTPSFVAASGSLPPFGYNLEEADNPNLGVEGQPASYWADETAANDGPIKLERAAQTQRRQGPTTHHFYDTKFRRVKYTARATSRYKSFFTPATDDDAGEYSRTSATTIDVLSSAPPDPPIVRAIIPVFRNYALDETEQLKRHVGGLRLLIERPWYSSGDGEQLAAVFYSGDLTVGDNVLNTRATSWGYNPRKLGGGTTLRPTLDDVVGADDVIVSHEFTMVGTSADPSLDAKRVVSLALYDPTLDADRDAILFDLEIDPGRAYYPWIQLALGRYQPNSIDGAHLSKIVLADFFQLSPSRTVSVAPGKENARVITVHGFSYASDDDDLPTSEIEVFAEQRVDGKVASQNSIWEQIASSRMTLAAERLGADQVTWSGEISPPEGSWRLTIIEREYYQIEREEDARPDELVRKSGKLFTYRMTFSETIDFQGP